MKEFNTTALCIPSKHYMVDITDKVDETKLLVDAGKYFTINRARQYGKTTLLNALTHRLQDEYNVLSLDFQDIENGSFKDGGEFSKAIGRITLDAVEFEELPMSVKIKDKFIELVNKNPEEVKLDDLFRLFRYWFMDEDKPFVLIIDEIDSAANNQVFMDFLAQLRSLYLKRERKLKIETFKSVILAGVSDIKYLKLKIRPENEKKENSPWNIAADYNVDMSLSSRGISDMLAEYASDHHIAINVTEIADIIHEYTEGYPFLVSRICQLTDIEVSKTLGMSKAWSRQGIDEAVKLILSENNTLFQSLSKTLNNSQELKESIRSLLMEGTRLTWNSDQREIMQMLMYGLVKNDHNTVKISNRIFETRIYNLFLSEEELNKNVFAREGAL